MKLYIDGPQDRGEGHYVLVAETGEYLAGHICSNISFARYDLHDRRPGWPRELADRFGEYQVLHLGEDDMTRDELVVRNHAWTASEDAQAAGQQQREGAEG